MHTKEGYQYRTLHNSYLAIQTQFKVLQSALFHLLTIHVVGYTFKIALSLSIHQISNVKFQKNKMDKKWYKCSLNSEV